MRSDGERVSKSRGARNPDTKPTGSALWAVSSAFNGRKLGMVEVPYVDGHSRWKKSNQKDASASVSSEDGPQLVACDMTRGRNLAAGARRREGELV